MTKLELDRVPEFKKWPPRAGVCFHSHRLGRCPPRFHVYRVDIGLFHRGPIARVVEYDKHVGFRVYKHIDLRRRGYTAYNGRYLIGHFEHVEQPDRCQRPWRPGVPWLLDLNKHFEISATAWCAPGERAEIDQRWDWYLPWPHADWPWLGFVVAGGWVFRGEEEAQ